MKPMERVPEPELMDEAEQARAYAEADFSEPHDAFVRHFRERCPDFAGGEVVDLGCGPGDVTARFARAFPAARILGVDGSAAMLDAGRHALAGDPVLARIVFRQMRLPSGGIAAHRYEAVISNSLLHHVADPRVLWDAVRSAAQPGAAIQVMDLSRPEDRAAADALVARHAADAPEVLKRDFLASLLAAYRPEEIRRQLDGAGLGQLTIEPVSDRHLLIWGRAT